MKLRLWGLAILTSGSVLAAQGTASRQVEWPYVGAETTPLKGGAIVTAGGLIFIGGGDRYLYAFDKMSGREVWRGAVPYANTATPMTYRTRSGQQFVVVATGTAADSALVAFALAGN